MVDSSYRKKLLDCYKRITLPHDDTAVDVEPLKSLLATLKKPGSTIDFPSDIEPLLSTLLRFLPIRETQSLVLLIVIQLENVCGPESVDPALIGAIEEQCDLCETRPQRYDVIEMVSDLYPVAGGACKQLFTKDEIFVPLLSNEITFLLGSNDSQLLFDDAHNVRVMLGLFSNSCIDQPSRIIIAKMYLGLLIKVLKLQKIPLQCLAATVTGKIYKSIPKETLKQEPELLSLEHLSEVLILGLVQGDDDPPLLESSIEGLAFLSLNVSVKQRLRNDDNFVNCLLEPHKDVAYGVLSIIYNLTSYNKVVSKRQQTLESLKSYAGGQVQKDDDEQVAKFVKDLLAKGVVEKISTILKSTNSERIQSTAVNVVSNLVTRKEHRSAVVNDGGLHILLTYLTNSSSGLKYSPESFVSGTVVDPETRFVAIRALSKIVMSTDPSNLKVDPITTVPFLLEVAVQYDGTPTPLAGLEIENADCFEALIALVNVSSLNNPKIKELTIKLAWKTILDLTVSSDRQIQRADLELISNLIASPLCMAKFFNWEVPSNRQNFTRLCQLLTLQDEQSQLAVLNIFANCSDYKPLAQLLSGSELFKEKLATIDTNNPDFLLRYRYILQNIN